MKSHSELILIWSNVCEFNGWLRLLKNTNRYSPQELRRLEKIDENVLLSSQEIEKEYDNNRLERMLAVKEFEQEFEEEFITKAKLAYLALQIRDLNKVIRIAWKGQARRAKTDMPIWLKESFNELDDIKDKEEQLNRLTKTKKFLENPIKTKKLNFVSKYEIEKARAYPFENLIKFNKLGFALCPFHNEKSPSFKLYKKDNSVHCFSCKWTGDTIEFLMKTLDIPFIEVVRKLS